MADIATDLITYLKTKSAITTLIGSGTAARIYNDLAKQGVSLPYIVFEVFEGTSEQHLNGISGIATQRIQVDAFAATRPAAHTLAEAIRLAPLQAYRGTFGTTFCHAVTAGSYEFGHDTPTAGGNQKRYWVSRDYIVTYTEDKE